MTEPLFEVGAGDPDRRLQDCDRCAWSRVGASDQGLRVRGWLVYDGLSVTGKPLRVRICPACQERKP